MANQTFSDILPDKRNQYARLNGANAKDNDIVTAFVNGQPRGYGYVEADTGVANCRFSFRLEDGEAESGMDVLFYIYDMNDPDGPCEYMAVEGAFVQEDGFLGTEEEPFLLSFPYEDFGTTLLYVR